ncbi:MAG: hypothetical protein IMF19_04555 [Proteobacteria bacterium]|nr:hypothetical protein [Pseudomonadota bacterium]
MAQERIKWTISPDGMLTIGFGNEMLDVHDIAKIYPTFKDMSEVQQMVIVYGIKQNLSDKIANMKDYTLKEKVKVMSERFQSLIDGIWKTPEKEKTSVKKKAEELAKSNSLTIQDVELLKKLGLYTKEIAKAFGESK